METFLLNATIYLGAAVIAVPIAARLGLGSVLGYLVAGLLIGPITGIDGGETEGLMHFAEFGVVMMLFLIGLELDPGALWDMRHRLMGLGGLQVLITTGVVTGGVMILGEVWQVSLAVGLTLALSSTAIVLQTLTEKGLMQSAGGRSTFSVLLTQDIAVIPMLVLVPFLAVQPLHHAGGDHEATVSLVEGLPGWGVALVTLGAVAAIIVAGRYLVRPLFSYIEASRLREMFTAVALLIVVGIATLMNLVGLSPALGAFLAGVMLANSEFRHQLETDIEPFKGLLLGLFFITVGAGMDVRGFIADPLRLISLAVLLMTAKAAVLAPLGYAFGLRRRDLWLFTLGLSQAGEFGFLMVTFALQRGVITSAIGQDVLTVIALSMLLTPLAFIGYELYARRSAERGEAAEEDEIDQKTGIIIVGIGRFGQVVNRLVRTVGFETTVLDNNLQTIQMMRRFGVKGFFGDPSRPDLLKAAGIETAKVLVVAVNNPEACTKIVAHARQVRPDLHIIARARDRTHVYGLYQAGANDIVREMFDSSLRVGRYVLENVGLSEFEANEAERMFYKHDRYMLRELANYWDPAVPPDRNEAYRERAIALDRDMESAMLTQLMALDHAPRPSREDDRDEDEDQGAARAS